MVIRIGQRVPDFSLPDTTGRERELSEFLGRGKVALAFFPFAFSGVCDKEMCVFRDDLSALNAIGAQPVGISVDSLFTLKIFAETYNLTFPLLSDFNKKVSEAYGALHDIWVAYGYKGVSKRAVFLVDKKRILRYRWITDNPDEEPPYEDVKFTLNKIR